MRTLVAVLAAALLVPPLGLSSQGRPPVEPGYLVRLTVWEIGTTSLTGPVLTVEDDRLTIIVEKGPKVLRGDTLILPFEEIRRTKVLVAGVESLLQPGRNVRVTAPGSGMRGSIAMFQAIRVDTLVLRSTSLPLASVTRLEAPWRRRSSAGTGALAGFAVGGAAGLALGIAWAADGCTGVESSGCQDSEALYAIVLGPALLGSVGAVIGLGMGALSVTESWHEVPLDRLRFSVAPRGDGAIGVGLSFTF